MTLNLVTAPTTEPLTLAEIKLAIHVDAADRDVDLVGLALAAREYAEHDQKRALITQTWDKFFDFKFPAEIELPMPPLQSVTSVTYIDGDGVSQTLATSDYTVDANREPGLIVPSFGNSWPSTQSVINAVTVRFVAGYGGPTSVPESTKRAMLMMMAHWLENPEAVVAGAAPNIVPLGVEALLSKNYFWTF